MTFKFSPIFILIIIQILFWIYFSIRIKVRNRLLPKASNRIDSNFKINLNQKRINLRNKFIMLGIIFLGIASSGPQIGTKVRPVERKGVDLVIAFDTSISMDSQDVSPSRITKAKFELSQLINNLNGDRVAIIVFAGSSHLYLPLTSDYEAALLFLNQIDTDMIPTKGTNLSSAFNTALLAFSDEEDKYKVMLIVSDGEDHEGKTVELSKEASKNGFVINTIGVGSESGSLIPMIRNNDQSISYKRDRNGKLITSTLNKKILEDIAFAGNGNFFWFDNNRDTYQDIVYTINNMEKKTISTHEFSEYEDRFQIFAFISFCLLMFGIIIPTQSKVNN